MSYMSCTTCRRLVYVNNTGLCLGCQIHSMEPQGDEWTPEKQMLEDRAKELEESLKKSENREEFLKKSEEIEDALQKSEAKSVDVCQQTSNGKRVGNGNPKRKKASKSG